MMMTRRKNRGFTLVEILIVAALIALLSGIAVFSINEFYENQTRKAVIGELYQLATASSFAHDDLQFFPKLHNLSDPASVIFKDPATGLQDPNRVIGGIDYFGFIPAGQPPQLTKLQAGWKGPYMGMSMTRNRSARGGTSGIVKMRLPDTYAYLLAAGAPNAVAEQLSLVDWPADVWGNPYVFYRLRSSSDVSGNLLPEFITSLGEDADYLNAIVSYGKNRFPGGNLDTPGNPRNPATAAGTLMLGALYVEGDLMATGAQFTLRVATNNPAIAAGIPATLLLYNGTFPGVHEDVLGALRFDTSGYTITPPDTACSLGLVGMQDPCNDDIVFEF